VIKKLRKSNRFSIKENIKLIIEKTNDSYPSLEVEKYAYGLKSNQINNKNVFDYRIEDSIIYLSPTINYDHDFFQEKEVKVTLYLPDNDSTVLINEFDD